MRTYFVPHIEIVGGAGNAVAYGAQWLVDHRDEGSWFILVPTRDQASNNDNIRALTSRGVPWGIPRNFPPRTWTGGPVLAPWANQKVIECINRNEERISSVCILKWLEADNRDWLVARQAIDVTNPGAEVLAPTISDGIVLEAMKGLTFAVNHTNNLTTSRDLTPVVRRLQYLRRHRGLLPVDEIIPWAMANGWTDIEVEKLRTIIDKVNSGRTFRGLDYGPIRDRGRLMREWGSAADQ